MSAARSLRVSASELPSPCSTAASTSGLRYGSLASAPSRALRLAKRSAWKLSHTVRVSASASWMVVRARRSACTVVKASVVPTSATIIRLVNSRIFRVRPMLVPSSRPQYFSPVE